MPASIRTTLHSSPGGPVVGPVLVDTSRDDLHKGYQVVLESVNAHSTYAWNISFKPESPNRSDSTAGLLAPEGSTSSTAKFNIDFEGAYLIRLVIDAGLPTESTEFIRARFLTRFANLKLVAAGERRDENGVIPIDATPEGWSNDQNQNLQLLLAQIRRHATGGRQLYVDSNRGRDVSANANDSANLYTLPGADPAATEDELQFTSEGHGDFATVNEAITFASAAAGRGEPALSATDPYYIFIKPGLYVEDLVLVDHVHLIGEQGQVDALAVSDSQSLPVIIRSANAGGNTHTFTPATDAAVCWCVGLQIENTAVTTKPVIEHDRGHLHLVQCFVIQRANGAAQGAAVETIVAGADSASLTLVKTALESLAVVDDARWALIFDSPGALEGDFSTITGRSGLKFNESLYTSPLADLSDSVITAGLGYGIRSGGSITLTKSAVTATTVANVCVVDGFGAAPNAKPGDVTLTFAFSDIARLIFNRDFVTGTTNVRLGGMRVTETSDQWIQAPDGALTEVLANVSDRSVEYHPQWRLPEDQPAGALRVPAFSRLPYANVQDVLDLMANVVNPAGSEIGGAGLYPGGLTLNAAYEGVASYDPFTVGAGLGRRILADNGAVQIIGAVSPGLGILDTLLRGGLQVDSVVDIGPIVVDGLGSEMFLEANPFGFGPRATFGRSVWHNELTTIQPRAGAAGVIRGGVNAAEGGYSLWLTTNSSQASGTTSQGRLILSGGRTNTGGAGNTAGAPVFIEAGDVLEPGGAGLAGDVWIAPGFTANAGDNGRIEIACPTTATAMIITSANATGPLTGDATLHLATPDTSFAIPLLNTDALAAIVTKINAITLGEIVASNPGANLILTSAKRGPNAEILVVGASALGGGYTSAQFFTDLGEIQESVSGGVTVKGAYPDSVAIECTADGVLTVHGSILATGGSVYLKWAVGAPASPLPAATVVTVELIGVDTTAGAGTVDLPNTLVAGDAGREFTIKYEAGANPVTVNGNGNNIDGAATQTLAILYESVTVYWDGTLWFIK